MQKVKKINYVYYYYLYQQAQFLFHDYILPNKKEIRFIKRRVKFIGYNTFGVKVSNIAGMHDSMIVILK